MAEKFIGAQVRAGEFIAKDTGKTVAYNNLVLYTTTDVNCGAMCNDPAKVANTGENIVKVFGRPITMDWLRSMLGKYICVFYDKYKKVERVMFFDTDPDAGTYGINAPAPTGGALPVDVNVIEDSGAVKDDVLSDAAKDVLASASSEYSASISADKLRKDGKK